MNAAYTLTTEPNMPSVPSADFTPATPPVAYEGREVTQANLVLEGGAMRGLFTSGVLDVFMERGLFCDTVIGVSAGALIGYNYVAGALGRSAYVNLKYCTNWRYLSMRSYVQTGNAFGRDFNFDEIPNKLEPFDYSTFNNSPMRLISVSSNIDLGEADYREITDGRADIPYLIASSSMPMVSEIVEVDGKKLLDGGTCDSIPITYSRTLGARKHIVICTQNSDYRKSANKLMPILRQKFSDYPYFIDRLQYRHFEYNRTKRALQRMHEAGEIFLIQPSKRVEISNMEQDQEKLLDLYEQGVAVAIENWDALQKYLAE